MQALDAIYNGDMERAREILRDVPVRDVAAELTRLHEAMQTLSEVSRELPGNRAERRAAARQEVKAL